MHPCSTAPSGRQVDKWPSIAHAVWDGDFGRRAFLTSPNGELRWEGHSLHLVDFCDEVNITLHVLKYYDVGLEVNITQNISELFQKYVFKIEISQCVIFICVIFESMS